MNLKSIAHALGGEISSGQVLCPGPGHSRQDRSLAVRIGRSGGIIVHSFCSDDWRECRDYVRERLGLRGPETAPWRPGPAREFLPLRGLTNATSAARIWSEAGDIRETLAEIYLTRDRRLTLDASENFSHALRFHGNCPFGAERAPAMVALMRDALTNEPRAIQRTRLAPDGTKICRATLGPAKGAAIKFDADENVTLGLVVTEGCETGLAARQVGYRPIWALGSAGAIQAFPVLLGIEGLTIHVEPGQASLRAVHECGARWRGAGRDAVVLNSLIGSDLNDAIRARAGA
jgi:putative DNA primase/helicase